MKPDGTFSCEYAIVPFGGSGYDVFKWKGRGRFSYNAKERKLTLPGDSLDLDSCQNDEWKDEKYNPAKLFCKSAFLKVEIPNFIWGVKTFLFPFYSLDQTDLKPELKIIAYKIDTSNYEVNAIVERIDNANQYSEELTISTPMEFGPLSLKPDNTLSYHCENTSYDRDGPYNWNSYFSYKGTWEYSLASKEITIRLHLFVISNDKKILSEEQIASFNLPTEIKTTCFCLEKSSYINCIMATWNYSDFAAFITGLSQKKNK